MYPNPSLTKPLQDLFGELSTPDFQKLIKLYLSEELSIPDFQKLIKLYDEAIESGKTSCEAFRYAKNTLYEEKNLPKT